MIHTDSSHPLPSSSLASWVVLKCSRQAPTSGPLYVLSPLPIKLCVLYFASSGVFLKSLLLSEASQGTVLFKTISPDSFLLPLLSPARLVYILFTFSYLVFVFQPEAEHLCLGRNSGLLFLCYTLGPQNSVGHPAGTQQICTGRVDEEMNDSI